MTFWKWGTALLGVGMLPHLLTYGNFSQTCKSSGEFTARWQQVFLVSGPLRCLSLQVSCHSHWRDLEGSSSTDGRSCQRSFENSSWLLNTQLQFTDIGESKEWPPFLFVAAFISHNLGHSCLSDIGCCGFLRSIKIDIHPLSF